MKIKQEQEDILKNIFKKNRYSWYDDFSFLDILDELEDDDDDDEDDDDNNDDDDDE